MKFNEAPWWTNAKKTYLFKHSFIYRCAHRKTLDLNSSLDIVLNKDTSNTFVLSLYILKHKPQMLIDKSKKNAMV